MENIVSIFGISGGALVVVQIVYQLFKRFTSSECVRGADGAYHLDVALRLTPAERAIVSTNPEVRDLLARLNDMLRQPPVPV